MPTPVLFPRFAHSAIEESFATEQARHLLSDGGRLPLLDYDQGERANDVVRDLQGEFVLVVTDPLLIASPQLGVRLEEALRNSDAEAAVPVANRAADPRQQRIPADRSLTLREMQDAIERRAGEEHTLESLVWSAHDPAVYLGRIAQLKIARVPLAHAIAGRPVILSVADIVHRWPAEIETDMALLPFVDASCCSLLELRCGDGAFGTALKLQQTCRVVGVEQDRRAAAIARRRLDDVYLTDPRELVDILDEQFDCIVAGTIVEEVADPWSFLRSLRRIARPGGQLIMSLSNVANASVIADLLRGRFDYLYGGLTSAAQLRFFSRSSIEDLLRMAGWALERIVPHEAGFSATSETLLESLRAAGLEVSGDLRATGYAVLARNEVGWNR